MTVSLSFIGITVSLFIPLLIMYYFRFFSLTGETEDLSETQLFFIELNIRFLFLSLLIFISSHLISLFLHIYPKLSKKDLDIEREVIPLKMSFTLLVFGIIFLILSIFCFLYFFNPYIFGFLIGTIIILLLIIVLAYVISKISTNKS